MPRINHHGPRPGYWASLRAIGIPDDALIEIDDHYRAVGRFLMEFESIARTAYQSISRTSRDPEVEAEAAGIRQALLDDALEPALGRWFAFMRRFAVHSEAEEQLADGIEEQFTMFSRARSDFRRDVLTGPRTGDFLTRISLPKEPHHPERRRLTRDADTAAAVDRLADEVWAYRQRLTDYGAHYDHSGVSPLSTILTLRYGHVVRLVPLSFREEVQRAL